MKSNVKGFILGKESKVMNSAKKIMNKADMPENKTAEAESVLNKRKKGIIGVSIGGILVLALVIAVLYENLHPKLIFTINDEKIYLGDIMADIYMNESTGEYMNQMYQQSYGSNYWEITNDEGITNAELVKDNTIETITQKYMMYHEALDSGKTLTEEENSEAEASAAEAYEKMSSATKNKTSLNKNDFIEYYKMQKLADNYKNEWIDSFDIDDAALIKDISEAELRQYDIQYYYIPFSTTDDSGNSIDMDEAQKQSAIDELKAAYNDIAGLEDFSTYVNNGNTTNADGTQATPAPGPKAPEGTNIKYTSRSFTEKNDPILGAELIEAVKAMANDEITKDVVTDDEGCYIIKMVNNNNKQSYENECKSVISEAENAKFTEEIENLEVEKYFIDINYDEWDKLEFGKITIN